MAFVVTAGQDRARFSRCQPMARRPRETVPGHDCVRDLKPVSCAVNTLRMTHNRLHCCILTRPLTSPVHFLPSLSVCLSVSLRPVFVLLLRCPAIHLYLPPCNACRQSITSCCVYSKKVYSGDEDEQEYEYDGNSAEEPVNANGAVDLLSMDDLSINDTPAPAAPAAAAGPGAAGGIVDLFGGGGAAPPAPPVQKPVSRRVSFGKMLRNVMQQPSSSLRRSRSRATVGMRTDPSLTVLPKLLA